MSPTRPAQLDRCVSRPDHAARHSSAACGRSHRRASRGARRRARSGPARLGVYRDQCGRRRELVALNGRGGSMLVIDRDAATLRDRLLLAHLAADEPAANAELVCRDYLACAERPRPRRLLAGDLLTSPAGVVCEPLDPVGDTSVIDVGGRAHRLSRVQGANGRSELRWGCSRAGHASSVQPVSLRELVGALESYEPMRTITAAAIRSHRHDRTLSLRHLQGEYRWLCTSPVVLNRALREAVLRVTSSGEVTMSEIALRCGIVKRGRDGGRRGETSWLARRVGLKAEGGASHVAPWIHSDVLALIAREGLRMSPHEVEVP